MIWGQKVADVRKMAVLRANGLGDFIFLLPALEALRAAYPAAQLVLLGKHWHATFLPGRGLVERVVVIPPYGGVGEPEGTPEDHEQLARFFATMQRERFDLALQVHGGGRYSNPFVNRLGSRLTVGLRTPEAAPLDRWLPYVYLQSEIVRYLEVVALLGAQATTLEPRLPLLAADVAALGHLTGLTWPLRDLVVMHPGASDPRRRWPVAAFAQVGDGLAAAGAQVVLIGTEAERALVEGVKATMRVPVLDLCGRLSLGALAALLRAARLVVGNDSGPLHLAEAVGTATVGIYWALNALTAGPLMRGRQRLFVAWQMTCPVCGLDCLTSSCAHRASFVGSISAEEVLSEARALFAAEAGQELTRQQQDAARWMSG